MPSTVDRLNADPLASWQEDANCADVDVEMFFSPEEDDQRHALELCRSCPVQESCLRYALQNRQMYGIWGGMEESDRRSIIRERRRDARRREREAEAA